MSKQSLGDRLKAFRLGRGWSQKRLADWLNISRTTLVGIEQGRKCQELTAARLERRLAEVESISAVA